MKRSGMKRGRGFAVHPALRDAVKGRSCLVCGSDDVDPAHLIPRGLAADFNDPRAVVPCCRRHHQMYDLGQLDLLPFLEPRFRAELGFAVERFGLLRTLERVTNTSWSERQAA
jgi:hypothetical protein